MTDPPEKTRNNTEKSVAHIFTVTGKATKPQLAEHGCRKRLKKTNRAESNERKQERLLAEQTQSRPSYNPKQLHQICGAETPGTQPPRVEIATRNPVLTVASPNNATTQTESISLERIMNRHRKDSSRLIYFTKPKLALPNPIL